MIKDYNIQHAAAPNPGAPGPSLLLMVCNAWHRQEVSHNNCAILFHFPTTPMTLSVAGFYNLLRLHLPPYK